MPPDPVLVSACLLGHLCRYDGKSNPDGPLSRLLEAQDLEPVSYCPEEAGGLPTPRPPAWIEATDAEAVLSGRDRVLNSCGADVTENFLAGAQGALETCRERGIRRAFLKERSPSCGCAQTHVGNALVDGPGVTAALLIRGGIQVEGVEGRQE